MASPPTLVTTVYAPCTPETTVWNTPAATLVASPATLPPNDVASVKTEPATLVASAATLPPNEVASSKTDAAPAVPTENADPATDVIELKTLSICLLSWGTAPTVARKATESVRTFANMMGGDGGNNLSGRKSLSLYGRVEHHRHFSNIGTDHSTLCQVTAAHHLIHASSHHFSLSTRFRLWSTHRRM